MKTVLTILACGIITISLAFGQTITSAGSGNWSDGATWVGGVAPADSVTDVTIGAGHTVTIDNAAAVCRNLSFQDTTGFLSMGSGTSVLTLYGNYTLVSSYLYKSFTAWPSGAKIRFSGSAVQTLSGWSTATGSTSFNEIVINKTGGKVVTGATNMRFGIGDTMEIQNGTFELASTDDIESRNFSGSATSCIIVVRSGGTFTMIGGGSHIRRASNTGEETKKIGIMSVYGTVELSTTSTNLLNFSGINIENGGLVRILTGWTPNKLNSGTITMKSGGTLENTTTTIVWYTNTTTATTVVVNPGGIFDTKASTTPLPPVFTNNGTVRYSRSVLDGSQTILDMNYHRLEVSFAGDGTGSKLWTVAATRTISDSLEVNNSAKFVLSAASAQTVNVNGTIRLTSGSVDNSDADIGLTLANGGTISRATGTITNAPVFGTSVNLRYTSTVTNVNSGAELPVSSAALNNLDIVGSQGMTLSANATVNGVLTFGGSAGSLITNSNSLTIASAGSISGEAPGRYVVGNLSAARAVGTGSSIFGGIGVSLASGTDDLGNVTVTRVTGSSGITTVSANQSIARKWNIISDNPPSSGRDLTLTWVSTDDNGKTFSGSNLAQAWRYNGSSWSAVGSASDISSTEPRSLTMNTTAFSDWTVSDANAPLPVELISFTARRASHSIELKWKTATEVNNLGFHIERRSTDQWISIGFINGNGTANTPNEYSFIDRNTDAGTFIYRLQQIDNNGNVAYSPIVEVTAGEIPAQFGLQQNFPNPFNPVTSIRYLIPMSSHVTLKVFDALGRTVSILADEWRDAGEYSVRFDATSMASGVYVYQINAGNYSAVKRMMLIK
ncbi:MAG: T9SS type A sorting domain-containing protein [Bacteroidota bacterium]